jgi:hypothetical protein
MTKTVASRRQKLEAEIKALERKEADTARFVFQRGFIGDTRRQVRCPIDKKAGWAEQECPAG